jgi:hypothetical protein
MIRTLSALIASLFAVAAFAAGPAQSEAQAPGSSAPKAAAETKHMKKSHGTSKAATQPDVQAQGSDSAKAAAEAKHTKKKHGNTNDSADKRTQKDAAKL